jgi:hypothetical protein
VKFPTKLYVKKVNDNDGSHYYVAEEAFAELADNDSETIEAAVYELAEVGKMTVRKEINTKPVKLRRVK